MIYLVTNRATEYSNLLTNHIQLGTLDQFKLFIQNNARIQLDTETTFIDDSPFFKSTTFKLMFK